MVKRWLARAWALLASLPVLIGGVAVAVYAVQAARRAREKAAQERRTQAPLDLPTPADRARLVQTQIDTARRIETQVQAARRAQRLAQAAAARIDSAGHPDVADLIRSWNRE